MGWKNEQAFWVNSIKFDFCRILSKKMLTFLKSKNDERCLKNKENSEYLKIQFLTGNVLKT